MAFDTLYILLYSKTALAIPCILLYSNMALDNINISLYSKMAFDTLYILLHSKMALNTLYILLYAKMVLDARFVLLYSKWLWLLFTFSFILPSTLSVLPSFCLSVRPSTFIVHPEPYLSTYLSDLMHSLYI